MNMWLTQNVYKIMKCFLYEIPRGACAEFRGLFILAVKSYKNAVLSVQLKWWRVCNVKNAIKLQGKGILQGLGLVQAATTKRWQ